MLLQLPPFTSIVSCKSGRERRVERERGVRSFWQTAYYIARLCSSHVQTNKMNLTLYTRLDCSTVLGAWAHSTIHSFTNKIFILVQNNVFSKRCVLSYSNKVRWLYSLQNLEFFFLIMYIYRFCLLLIFIEKFGHSSRSNWSLFYIF